ncbi:MAG: sugar kinase [Bacteroidota bacterium]
MSSIEYAIIVKDATRLEQLIERFNTKGQARFYLENQGGDFGSYEREHELFYRTLDAVQQRLHGVLKTKLLARHHLPNFLFTAQMLVIVVGRDGLVANAAKYVGAAPVIGINPDPTCYTGVLLPFRAEDFIEAVRAVLSQRAIYQQARFAEATLSDGQRLLGFNDLFIGARTHVSARYKIRYNQQEEQHSSSGIIVSTEAGATGWLSSLYNMLDGLAGRGRLQIPRLLPKAEELIFAVREPYRSANTGCGIVAGRLHRHLPLVLESLMPTGGVIFSDGIEADFLEFNSGAIATIGISTEYARLVRH